MSVIQERFFFQLFRRPRFSFPLQKNNCFPKATEPRLFYLFSFSNQSLGLETQLAGAAPLLLSAPSDFAMHAAVTHRACAPQGPGRLSRGPVARRAVFAFFGVLNGTECNPAFSQEAARALEGRRRVVAYCNAGGSFGSETNGRGTQSRSMSAAYELIRAGICGNNRVRIDMLKGGYNEWMKEREVVVPE